MPRRAGVTLVELLVVIAILAMLLALLVPAVQQSREAARLTQCRNQVKQLALAFLNHEDVHGHYPTGGWGTRWVGSADLGFGENQGGGWGYTVLPFLDQQTLFHLSGTVAANRQRIQTPLPVMICPSRRRPGPFPTVVRDFRETATPGLVMRSDYAANCGDQPINEFMSGPFTRAQGLSPSFPWPATDRLTGISFQRSEIRHADLQDGTSSTYLLGEKYLNPLDYETGMDNADNECGMSGFDNDNFRSGAVAPRLDLRGLTNTIAFGSAHPGGFTMSLCDGSIRSLGYSIDLDVHCRLANRQDHRPVVVP